MMPFGWMEIVSLVPQICDKLTVCVHCYGNSGGQKDSALPSLLSRGASNHKTKLKADDLRDRVPPGTMPQVRHRWIQRPQRQLKDPFTLQKHDFIFLTLLSALH